MGKRVVTGVIFTVVLVLGALLQGWFLRLLLLFAMLVSIREMYGAFKRLGAKPVCWTGYVYCVLAALAQALSAELRHPVFQMVSPQVLALSVSLVLAMTVVIARGKLEFENLMTTVFPMLYPGLFFSIMIGIQDLNCRFVAALALALTFFIASVNDVFALLIGVKFGKHRLSPLISPKKSVEGSIAGIVACTLFAIALPAGFSYAAHLFPVLNPTNAVLPPLWTFGILGLVAGALSQVGDLTASLVKRHCGIKDFGTILPGHGGMMDRMDGILFCSVACYLFFRLSGL